MINQILKHKISNKACMQVLSYMSKNSQNHTTENLIVKSLYVIQLVIMLQENIFK